MRTAFDRRVIADDLLRFVRLCEERVACHPRGVFLDCAGFPPERDLELALSKDAGIDPGVLSWLLRDFPTRPLPQMLLPLDEGEVLRCRDDLRDRFRRASLPG